jgi:hypothetical protein
MVTRRPRGYEATGELIFWLRWNKDGFELTHYYVLDFSCMFVVYIHLNKD